MSQTETPPTESGSPEPFMQGTFALYETPDGGMVLSYFSEMTGQQQQVIPPFLVKQGRSLMQQKGGMGFFGKGKKS